MEDGKLTITRRAVTVTVVGNHAEAKYDKQPHTAAGYETYEADDELYSLEDVDYSGNEVKAERTEVGTTYMGLTKEQYSNKNNNFDVTFNVTDGYVTITDDTAEIVVRIRGNQKTETYNGQSYEVTGYTVEIVGSDLYTEADIAFTGEAKATGTDAGTYPMNLDANQFSNANTNFTNVRFELVEDGKLTITPATLTIVTDSKSKTYDGTALTAPGSIDGFVNGETATFEVTGSQTEVGKSDNTYSLTWDGTAKESNYTVSKDLGTLEVTQREVEVRFVGPKVTRVYNGAEQSFTTTTVIKAGQTTTGESYIVVTGLVDADSVVEGTLMHAMARTNVGTTDGTFSWDGTHKAESKPTIMNGTTDVTNCYKFIYHDVGKLEITPREVKIRVNDNNVPYDGQAHGKKEGNPYTVLSSTPGKEDGLVDGHQVDSDTVEIPFTATAVGEYKDQLVIDNAENVKIKAKAGTEDVTPNYRITTDPGTLTIIANTTPLVIESDSQTWIYDGTVHTYPVYTVSYNGVKLADKLNNETAEVLLPTGDTLRITNTGSVQFVEDNKEKNNTFTYEIFRKVDKEEENRESGYGAITTNYGTLQIGRRKLALKAASETWEYKNTQGAVKTCPRYTVAEWVDVGQSEPEDSDWHTEEYEVGKDVTLETLDTIVHEMSDVKVDGSIQYVGKVPNVPSYKNVVIRRGEGENAKIVTDNYEFIKLYNGVLEITGDPLEPEKTIVKPADDPDKKYDIGDKIEFTITVKNTTTQTLQNVRVYDATAELLIDNDPNLKYGDNVNTVIIASIDSGTKVTIKALHTVTEEDITRTYYENVVETSVKYDDQEREVTADVTTNDIVDPRKELKVTKELWENDAPVADDRVYKPGEIALFKITVTNTGNQTLKNITISEISTYLDGTAAFLDGTTEQLIDQLAPGKPKEFYATYVVTDGDLQNLERLPKNIVTAKSDDLPEQPIAGEEIPLPEPVKLTIHYVFADGKTAFPDYTEMLRPGATYYRMSPVLEGYTFRTPVTGVMPDEDHVEWVTYFPEGGGGGDDEEKPDENPEPREVTTLLDYPTPLGLNNVFMNVGDCFE